MNLQDRWAAVAKQYSPDSGAIFYRYVMGDRGAAIHYGHYLEDETPMRVAVEVSTWALLEMAKVFSGIPLAGEGVDLGSGAGGSAHFLARETGAKVCCVDLCQNLNEDNLRDARALGLGDLVSTWEGSFHALPSDWGGRFAWAWSQDAFCHAEERRSVFEEAARVLKAEGRLIFSDLFRDEQAGDEDLCAFTGVNAVGSMGTIGETLSILNEAGFEVLGQNDWSHFLCRNFVAMAGQIEKFREEMVAQGVDERMIEVFAESLRRRREWRGKSPMRWVAFVCQKKASHKE